MSCSSPTARTSEVTDPLVVVLKITLVVSIASGLRDMGLRLDPANTARGLRNVRFVDISDVEIAERISLLATALATLRAVA